MKKLTPYLTLLFLLFCAHIALAVNSNSTNSKESKKSKSTNHKSYRYNFSLFQFMNIDTKHERDTNLNYNNAIFNREDSLNSLTPFSN